MKEQTYIRKKGKAQNAADYLPSENLSLNTYLEILFSLRNRPKLRDRKETTPQW